MYLTRYECVECVIFPFTLPVFRYTRILRFYALVTGTFTTHALHVYKLIVVGGLVVSCNNNTCTRSNYRCALLTTPVTTVHAYTLRVYTRNTELRVVFFIGRNKNQTKLLRRTAKSGNPGAAGIGFRKLNGLCFPAETYMEKVRKMPCKPLCRARIQTRFTEKASFVRSIAKCIRSIHGLLQ